MENFMIQGGGGTEYKDGKLTSKYADSIKGEFYENGVANNLKHMRGVISMARTSKFDSASSQFFIMHAESTSLNGSYAAFGYVLAGMDVVDAIATCEVDATDKNAPFPVDPVVIETMKFVTPK
jgi:peptidyl-prolyl cis-trans isomerase B (cyclophilin B)